MRILQLCKKFPYPIKDGEVIAITNLAKALHQSGSILDLLCMNTSKHFFDNGKRPKALYFYNSIQAVNINTDLKLREAFFNLFSKESYHISRFVDTEYEKALTNLLQQNQYDIIQLETVYLAPYISVIRKNSKAKIAMRAHNVEHEIWQRIANNSNILPKKWYLNYLTSKLKRFEKERLQDYDILVPITQKDSEYFMKMGYSKPASVTPIGINISDYQPDYSSFDKELSLSFIGSLDWMPNAEGIQWFLEKVWNQTSKIFPEFQLHIAGRNTPNWVYKPQRKNVIIHGEVPDAHDFINQHSIMIVPLFSGSGMRVKILEGMALGKVVITTTMGLEGIDATPKKEVLIADSESEFIACFEYCSQNKAEIKHIGQQARQLIETKYNNEFIAQKLLLAYQTLD